MSALRITTPEDRPPLVGGAPRGPGLTAPERAGGKTCPSCHTWRPFARFFRPANRLHRPIPTRTCDRCRYKARRQGRRST